MMDRFLSESYRMMVIDTMSSVFSFGFCDD